MSNANSCQTSPALQPYIGRFAPSPSGPLHFGSLITALGSFLQARHKGGKWLLRIDDIDPPREMPGAKQVIINSLKKHGLEWDGPVIFQSERQDRYDKVLEQLEDRGLSYFCQCTRKQIKEAGGIYPGTCRLAGHSTQGSSIRFLNEGGTRYLKDSHLGMVEIDQQMVNEDFVIRRKDGLIGYHLASVIDDIDFAVSEVIRGADLLDPSGSQLSLFRALNAPLPDFIHLPVAATKSGFKLSKQNHATAIDGAEPIHNIVQGLKFLGQPTVPKDHQGNLGKLIDWAVSNWSLEKVPKSREILIMEEQNQ